MLDLAQTAEHKVQQLREAMKKRIQPVFGASGAEFSRAREIFERGNDVPILVLFADLSGSTKKGAEQPVDALLDTLRHHFAMGVSADEVVTISGDDIEHRVIKTVGDEIILSFALKDGLRAENAKRRYSDLVRFVVAAALEAANVLWERRIPTKIGIHLCTKYVNALEAAEAVRAEGWPDPAAYFPRGDLLGHHMNVAARLVSAAKPRNVLVSQQVVECVESSWSPIILSDPLHFQGWRGLERAQEVEKVAFLAGLGDKPVYEWPFHCVAYVVRRGRTAQELSEVFSPVELTPNLVDIYQVEREGCLKRRHGRRYIDWSPPDAYGLVRAVADSFDSYNTAMTRYVYSRSRALTYSHALVLSEEGIGQGFEKLRTRMEQSKRVQPRLEADWQHSTRGRRMVAALLKTGSFEGSKRILQRFLASPTVKLARHLQTLSCEIDEACLLYGEWDVFVSVEVKNNDATRPQLEALAAAILAETKDELRLGRESAARFFLGSRLMPGTRSVAASR